MIIYQKKIVGVKKMTKDVRKRFTFRIPHDMYEQLKHKAKKRGVSINSLILMILDDWDNDKRGENDG